MQGDDDVSGRTSYLECMAWYNNKSGSDFFSADEKHVWQFVVGAHPQKRTLHFFVFFLLLLRGQSAFSLPIFLFLSLSLSPPPLSLSLSLSPTLPSPLKREWVSSLRSTVSILRLCVRWVREGERMPFDCHFELRRVLYEWKLTFYLFTILECEKDLFDYPQFCPWCYCVGSMTSSKTKIDTDGAVSGPKCITNCLSRIRFNSNHQKLNQKSILPNFFLWKMNIFSVFCY